MYKVGVVTLSDRGFQGRRQDESGAWIKKVLVEENFQVIRQIILPDEKESLVHLLKEWCEDCDLILTTGGTGLGVRDITPEATLSVADRMIPGISEGLRQMSLVKMPLSMLSRGVSVQRERTIIINLPGSLKAVQEYLPYLLPILPHALDVSTSLHVEH